MKGPQGIRILQKDPYVIEKVKRNIKKRKV